MGGFGRVRDWKFPVVSREELALFLARFSGPDAHVAELVDALDSGSSGVTPVEVRVLS